MPAGHQGPRPGTGLVTDFGVKGDFEITLCCPLSTAPAGRRDVLYVAADETTLVSLQAAAQGLATFSGRTSYFIGHETFVVTGRSNLPAWRRALFMFLARNSRPPTEFFGIPPNDVVELGAQIEL